MDFRQISCFVAVAEELHFGRAAARLNLSQPPLSQQIKGLEDRLRVRLFERNRRSVRLTPAGEAFLPYAHQVLNAAAAGADAARRVAGGEIGELRIGYSASALYSDEVLATIARYRRRYPAVEIRLVENTTRTCTREVEAGRVDLAIVRGPLPETAEGWPADRRIVVSCERLLVALPADHALAGRDRLALAELGDERFVIMARQLGTALNDLLDRLFAAAGLRPRIALETAEMASLLGLVGAGAGIAIVPEAVTGHRSGHVAFRPLTDRNAEVELFLLLPPLPSPTAVRLRAEMMADGAG
ncbi:LysR family transcriptional regulator [Azospirillum humicireducens]|uniref:LysR family transcriptional regulator n=1 Tax=Azospirillum humicireducens TaxID=1226968 RepID=A0A160JD04_9PROT|nr:LysR family transcriptional regulator [Azospirillum humicireducens]ANC90553.1 LysR family transcriptional regulator [Azospirillum humicireducens]